MLALINVAKSFGKTQVLMLQGAVPAALLAVVVQGLFELLERVVVPKRLAARRAVVRLCFAYAAIRAASTGVGLVR